MSAPTTTRGRGAPAGDVNLPVIPVAAAPPDTCIHDLLAASCIWCTPRPDVMEVVDDDHLLTGPRLGGWRIASNHYPCTGCGEPIQPGDTYRPKGRARYCEECGEADG